MSSQAGDNHFVSRVYQSNKFDLASTYTPSSIASDLASLAAISSGSYFHELIYVGCPGAIAPNGASGVNLSLSSVTISSYTTIAGAIKAQGGKVGIMLSLGSSSGTNLQSPTLAVAALTAINTALSPKPDFYDFDFIAQASSATASAIVSYLKGEGQESSMVGGDYSYGKASPGTALSGSGKFVGHYVTTIPSPTQVNCTGFANKTSSQVSLLTPNATNQTSTVRMGFPVVQNWCGGNAWSLFDNAITLAAIKSWAAQYGNSGGNMSELEVTEANYNPFPLQTIPQPVTGQTITVKLTPVGPPPPSIKRVIFSMGENANWDPTNGFSEQSGAKVNCPYLTSLASAWGIALNFHGLTSQSLPNYLEEAFGSDYNITSDKNPPLPALQGVGSIQSLCAAKGVAFHAYMQSQPATNPYADAGSGTSVYIAHHNPWAYVWNVLATYNSKGVSNTLPSAASLPKGYNWVGPNGYYSGHTPNNIANFDAWVKSYYGFLISSIASGAVTDTVIILCIDNGYLNNLQTYCVVIGPNSKSKSSATTYGHADVLATIENLLGLGNLGKDDATAQVMSDLI